VSFQRLSWQRVFESKESKNCKMDRIPIPEFVAQVAIQCPPAPYKAWPDLLTANGT